MRISYPATYRYRKASSDLFETEIIVQGTLYIEADLVRSYAEDLKSLLEESDFAESKAFLRSFIKKIVISGEKATIYYNLPMPPDRKKKQQIGVLPIVTLGGPYGTVPELLFERKQLIPALQQLLVSYQPPTR